MEPIKPYKQEALAHAFRMYLRVPDTFNQGDYLPVNVYDRRVVMYNPGAHVRAGANIFIDVNEQVFNNSQTLHQWYAARRAAEAQARAAARAEERLARTRNECARRLQ